MSFRLFLFSSGGIYLYKGFAIFIVALIIFIMALWFCLIVYLLGYSIRHLLLFGLLIILPGVLFAFAKNKKRVNKNEINYIKVSNHSSEQSLSSLENEEDQNSSGINMDFSFEYLIESTKIEYEIRIKDPFNMGLGEAAAFLCDDSFLMKDQYFGYKESLYIVLAHLLIEHSYSSPYFNTKALKVIDENFLPELWRKNKVPSELISKRIEFLIDLKRKIIEQSEQLSGRRANMKEIFSNYGIVITEKGGKYYLTTDSGGMVSRDITFEISKSDAEKSQISEQEAYWVILKYQNMEKKSKKETNRRSL